MSAVRVFHCDDSSGFRILVREMLDDLGGIELVGEAATLDEALERLPRAAPQVVLVDLFDRDREAELLALLRAAAPAAAIVLYTGMPAGAVPEGADAHVHKSMPFEKLHRTIIEVAAAT